MSILDAIILGIVEGLTEFLPVSSTGHLTIAEKLLGKDIDAQSVTAFTAVIQVGAIVAVLIYFREDIVKLLSAVVHGFRNEERRKADPNWRFAWLIVIGSVPIGIAGLAAKSVIEGPFRSLWVVAFALILWSPVMVRAERRARQSRGERQLKPRDAIVIGLVQCFALIPGVSRSGATISAGLVRGFDRVTATRLSFFLAIPALVAAGLYELKDALGQGVGAGPTIVGTIVSFVVAYVSIAWLLRFVAHHSIVKFVPYRVGLGVVIVIVLLATGASAT
ncbi:MAG TPA: undecaprenyl-diphosphate phosphatase [Thermoleophilaceae bacterium]|nr:undecaprenyl-diphosphate phosphatase [Thermoleophilaceae bacterium]